MIYQNGLLIEKKIQKMVLILNKLLMDGILKLENTTSTRPSVSETPVPQNLEPSNPDLLQEGMRVVHAKFGAGTILSVEGAGANKKASVNFDHAGVKMLMLKFARLAIIK